MESIHYLQMQILRKLLFAKSLSFSQLKPDNIENNKFDFHLKELIRFGYIKKLKEGYTLSDNGKEYANRMDTDNAKIQKQAKIGAISVALRQDQNKEWEYLVYTRLKQPFYGRQGFPSGKVRWGETTLATSKREFKEETNLDGEPELYKVRHYIVFKKETGELVEDKIFFFHRIINPKGELKPNNEGKFEWVKEKDLRKYLTKPFDDQEETIAHAIEAKNFNGQIDYLEREERTENF